MRCLNLLGEPQLGLKLEEEFSSFEWTLRDPQGNVVARLDHQSYRDMLKSGALRLEDKLTCIEEGPFSQSRWSLGGVTITQCDVRKRDRDLWLVPADYCDRRVLALVNWPCDLRDFDAVCDPQSPSEVLYGLPDSQCKTMTSLVILSPGTQIAFEAHPRKALAGWPRTQKRVMLDYDSVLHI